MLVHFWSTLRQVKINCTKLITCFKDAWLIASKYFIWITFAEFMSESQQNDLFTAKAIHGQIESKSDIGQKPLRAEVIASVVVKSNANYKWERSPHNSNNNNSNNNNNYVLTQMCLFRFNDWLTSSRANFPPTAFKSLKRKKWAHFSVTRWLEWDNIYPSGGNIKNFKFFSLFHKDS